jgi:hypothetical protein
MTTQMASIVSMLKESRQARLDAADKAEAKKDSNGDGNDDGDDDADSKKSSDNDW